MNNVGGIPLCHIQETKTKDSVHICCPHTAVALRAMFRYNSVDFLWLKHLLDFGNLFEQRRVNHMPDQETNRNNLRMFLQSSINNGMLRALIRVAQMRRF